MKILALVGMLAFVQAQSPANITGTWQWRGAAGWQRIELNLKADGTKLTGVLRMGPGSQEPATPADFWEYFFDPVDFKITNGKVEGNQIGFEQSVVRPAGSAQAFGGPVTSFRPAFETRFLYKGVVQGDQIVMTREIAADKRDPLSLGGHKVEFILQRVK